MAENAIAYNRLTPIREDFGDSLTQAENQGFKYREEQRLIEEQERQRNKDFQDKYSIDPNEYFLENTEFRTVNEVGREAIHQIRDKIFDLKKKLRTNPNNLGLQKQWDKLQYSIKALKDGHQKFKTVGDEYLKSIENDEISGLDENKWKDRLEAYDEGRIRVKIDDDANLNYEFFDRDGKFVENVNYKDLIQGSLRKRIDVDKEAKDLLSVIGATKRDVNTGGFVKSINEWGARQEAQSRKIVDAYLSDPDVVDDILFQIGLRDEGNAIPRERKKEIAAEYIQEVMRGAFNEASTLRPFNRPVGRTRSTSFGDLQKRQTASNLFDISMRAAAGEKGALDQIVGSRIKVQDGDKTMEKTISDYANTEEGTVFLDANRNVIATVPNDSDSRRRALRFAMIVENGQSADNVQSTFEIGESLNDGRFLTGDIAPNKVEVQVPDVDVSKISKLPREEENAVKYLRGEFEEAGFKFKQALIGLNAVKITAPNGQSKRFYTSEVDEIKQFMEENANTKIDFQDPAEKTDEEIANELINKYRN